MALFYGWRLTASRLQSHYEKAAYSLPLSSRNSWYSFDRPWKNERLSQPWSHPVVLNTEPHSWKAVFSPTVFVSCIKFLFRITESKHGNFQNTKSFWHMKDMSILSQKIPGYKHACIQNRDFMTSQRLNMAELTTIMYLRNRML